MQPGVCGNSAKSLGLLGHRLCQLRAVSWEETGRGSRDGDAAEVLKRPSVTREEGAAAQGRKSARDPALTAVYSVGASFFFIKEHPALDSTCFLHTQVLVVNEDLLARIGLNHSSASPGSIRAAPSQPAHGTKPLVPFGRLCTEQTWFAAHKMFFRLCLGVPHVPSTAGALRWSRNGQGPHCCSSQHR